MFNFKDKTTKAEFIKSLLEYWKETPMDWCLNWNPDKAHAVAETAWQDYYTFYKLYSKTSADIPTSDTYKPDPKKWKFLIKNNGGNLVPIKQLSTKGGTVGAFEVRSGACHSITNISYKEKDKEKLREFFPNLTLEDEALIKFTIDLPVYAIATSIGDKNIFGPHNTELMTEVSNSNHRVALLLIEAGADGNKYSAAEGNTPLLLAVSKGWNHIDTAGKVSPSIYSQRLIIRALLEHEADVNLPHLFNGMTAVHLAFLRGDSVEFIELLIKSGADLGAKDYKGRTPFDLLKLSHEDMQGIINSLVRLHYEDPVSSPSTWDRVPMRTLPNKMERNQTQQDVLSPDFIKKLPLIGQGDFEAYNKQYVRAVTCYSQVVGNGPTDSIIAAWNKIAPIVLDESIFSFADCPTSTCDNLVAQLKILASQLEKRTPSDQPAPLVTNASNQTKDQDEKTVSTSTTGKSERHLTMNGYFAMIKIYMAPEFASYYDTDPGFLNSAKIVYTAVELYQKEYMSFLNERIIGPKSGELIMLDDKLVEEFSTFLTEKEGLLKKPGEAPKLASLVHNNTLGSPVTSHEILPPASLLDDKQEPKTAPGPKPS